MRIAVVGGGPGGLLFATIAARTIPGAKVDLFERKAAAEAFGFGVVFSSATQRGVDEADSALHATLNAVGRRWDPVEVRLKGQRFSFAGNGMGALLRKDLLSALQREAAAAGAALHFSVEAVPHDLRDYDVVVAADGANSRLRSHVGDDVLGVSYDIATAKFIWFATTYQFDGLTFVHAHDPRLEGADVRGVFAAHTYPIGHGLSTFIVETDEDTWLAAGLDGFDAATPPGVSDERARHELERIFAPQIDGHPLVANNSRWGNFRTIRTATWHHGNTVFLGDAVHTAHFSVGSGTKMALEDAIALARALKSHPDDLDAAFGEYEDERRPRVEHIQDLSRPSLSWWEHFGQYYWALEPWQFAFHFFSRAIPLSKITRRDPVAADAARAAWRQRHGADPLDSPLEIGTRTGPPTPILRRVLTAAEASGLGLPRIAVPRDEREIAAAVDAALGGRPAAGAIVEGGTPVGRSLAAEAVRFRHRVPALIAAPGIDDDLAETLILSGRADGIVR